MSGMTQYEVRRMLTKEGLIRDGSHVVLPNGSHTSVYLDKEALIECPAVLFQSATFQVGLFSNDSIRAVVSAAGCAERYAQRVAQTVSGMERTEVPYYCGVPTENGRFDFAPHDAAMIAGRRVLVIEDIITFGGTVKRLLVAVRRAGGHPVGIGALWNRGPRKDTIHGVPLRALISIPSAVWRKGDRCLCCAAGAPIVQDFRVNKDAPTQ